MKFSSYLDPQFIFTDLKGTTPEEVINEMVEKIAEKDKKVFDFKAEIIASVIKREKEISTGMGNGIAIPFPIPVEISFSLLITEAIISALKSKTFLSFSAIFSTISFITSSGVVPFKSVNINCGSK